LSAALGLELELADVVRLQERTEGWAAGLYLAALSLRGRDDARAFIESFAGDDRQIVDYLSAEVLAGQPDDVREFLLRTSILERLCGTLCDAVTESSDSQAVLDEIEHSNLFLVPLDTTRKWYRYHHLFRELLHHELQRTEPGSVVGLHDRAHRWHAAHGTVGEAITHAIAASNVDAARRLIAASWNEFFNQGRLQTVSTWLGAMPPEVVEGDPRLCAAGAWLALDRGRIDEAAQWIGSAELAVRTGAVGEEADFHESEIAALRAVHSFKVADLARAEDAARRALELEPEPGSFPDFVARCILGITLYWRGEQSAEAIATLEQAVRIAREASNDLGHGYALGYLALASAERGQLDQAERLAETALGLSDDPGFVEHFVTMLAHLSRGRVEMRRGQLEAAGVSISRALVLARRGAGALELAAALNHLAEVRQLQGAREDAAQLAREARLTLDRATDVGTVGQALEATERSLRVAERQAARAAPLPEPLTDRESAVLRLLDSDLSRREIGEALYVSVDTVKTHVRGIYRKLGVSTRQEAVEHAHEVGLL
jgi:LuxR family maltose regulon positive regulatory protein